MNNDKLILLSSAVDLCMRNAKGYQPEMFGSDQECYTAKVVAMELAGEIRNLPATDTEALQEEIEALKRRLANEKSLTQHTYECAETFRNKAERLEKELADVKRERDALKHDFLSLACDGFSTCCLCNHFAPSEIICKHSMEIGAEDIGDCFAWRGPCEENGGAE